MEDKVSGNAAADAAESNSAPAKKASKSKAKSQQKKVSSRPPTSEMVTAAIKELKDRKGSSFQAIKKYIVSTYKVDGEKVAPFIKRYLKTAVSAGAVVQTKGKGATGSFKLSTDKPKDKAKGKAQRASLVHSDTWKAGTKKDAREKTAIARKPAAAAKKTTAKKAPESPKKAAPKTAAAKTAVKKGKAAAEPKSPSKAKKAVKAPAAKTKTPKPKKATAKTVKAAAKK
ncbi:late histone H1-like [Temnothorax curvispinosus]|uniref:Late histone H1-like n=2 Tax=Temnothorax TaxID=300110 RepID=A0A6J1R4M5_9HYME|nr:late histone H1-like [Temnothorax curvispinosus]TGZ46360.1 Histone H1 [Temnothorax longispinosus]